MLIPRGKEVKIKKNGEDLLPNVKLTLASDMTLTLQSTFDTLLGDAAGNASTLLTVVGGVVKSTTGFGFSGQFKEMGYRIWKSTEPIKFSCEVMLNMVTSGEKDVFRPAQLLMKMPLPENAGAVGSGSKGVGLIAPGPTITDAMGLNTKKGAQFSFRCGIYYLPSIVIEEVEPTFSSETDSDGYPIWCQLKIDVTSIFTATQDQIDDFGYGNKVNTIVPDTGLPGGAKAMTGGAR